MIGGHRVYRNISKREELLGLELSDALFLLFFFGILNLFSISLLARLSSFAGIYLLFRFFKKGKPEKYLWSIARFIRSPKAYSALGVDAKEPYRYREKLNGTDQTKGTES